MGTAELSAFDLHNPHVMDVDQRTMQAIVRERHDYLRVESRGKPVVYVRDGRFHQADGAEFDMAHYPGGEKAFLTFLKKNYTPDALKAVGIAPDPAPAAV